MSSIEPLHEHLDSDSLVKAVTELSPPKAFTAPPLHHRGSVYIPGSEDRAKRYMPRHSSLTNLPSICGEEQSPLTSPRTPKLRPLVAQRTTSLAVEETTTCSEEAMVVIARLQKENESLKEKLRKQIKETEKVQRQLSVAMQTGSTTSRFAQQAAASWVSEQC